MNVGYLQALSRPLPTYTGPPWLPVEPDRPATDEDVARFLAVYPDATCSPKTLRALAALMRDFAPEKEGVDATPRTPGDPGPARQP